MMGSYEKNPNSCSNCPSDCAFCFGDSRDDCYSYKARKYCNNSTCVDCPQNCTICSSPEKCSVCSEGYALFWDYSCRNNSLCLSPYILEGLGALKQCKTPCQPNEYMLWNETCTSSCPFPLQSVIHDQAMFCNYPCNKSNGEYLYWNGSCLPDCNYVKRNESGYRFCDACQSGYFFYPTNKCLPFCPNIFARHTQGGSQIYEYSCRTTTDDYYPECKSNKDTCAYPYKIESTFLCLFDLSEAQTKELQRLSDGMNGVKHMLSLAFAIGSFIDFRSLDASYSTNLVKMLWYIRYMDIKYPPRLYKILQWQKMETGLAELLPKIPEKWRASAPKYPLPGKFDHYKHHSNFLVNFWQSLIVLLILTGTIVLVSLIGYLNKRTKSFNSITEKVKYALKWNIFLSLYLNSYDIMILYSSLELRTVQFNNLLFIISFIVCLGMNTLALLVLIETIRVISLHRILNQSQSSYNHTTQMTNWSEKWQSYAIIFTYYKETFLLQQAFVFIFITRLTLFNLIIAYLNGYSLLQAICITLLSLLALLYIVILRPLKQKMRLLQHLLQETILLIVNVCVLVLAVFDHREMKCQKERETIGEIIIGCNIAFFVLSSLFLGLIILSKIWEFYQDWGKETNNVQTQEQETVEASTIANFNLDITTSNTIENFDPLRKGNTSTSKSHFKTAMSEHQFNLPNEAPEIPEENTLTPQTGKLPNIEIPRKHRRDQNENLRKMRKANAIDMTRAAFSAEDTEVSEDVTSQQSSRSYKSTNHAARFKDMQQRRVSALNRYKPSKAFEG